MMDSQTHILSCSGYEDLRVDRNLENEKDLVDYNFGARSQRDMECLNGIPRAIIVDYNRELHKSLNYSYNSF